MKVLCMIKAKAIYGRIYIIFIIQTAASKCSVILVDRSLDFVAATTQACQTLADKIFGLLPRLPQHSVDVAVDMTLLTDTPDK